MDGISSDYNATMAATLKFDAILSTVQSSNLNFHVEISPFSAVIHLKKSLIVNKLGIPQIPPPDIALLLEQQKSYNFVLAQRIVFLENVGSSMKSDYENALMDCTEANKTISKLKEDLEIALSVKHEAVSVKTKEIEENKADEAHKAVLEMLESKVVFLENQLVEKEKDAEKALELQKKYKTEMKCLDTKLEKVKTDSQSLKSEKNNLEMDVNKLSVALKSAKQEAKEGVKIYDSDKKKLEKEIVRLIEFKIKHEQEARKLKKREKKQKQIEKKENKKDAQLEIERVKAEKEAAEKEIEESETDDELALNVEVANYFETLPRNDTEQEPDLNSNSQMTKAPSRSLDTTPMGLLTSSSLDPSSSSLLLTASLDTTTSLMPSMNLDLTYNKNLETRLNSTSTPSSDLKLRTSTRRSWKCETCEASIPWGLTFDQALHMEKHRKEMKS